VETVYPDGAEVEVSWCDVWWKVKVLQKQANGTYDVSWEDPYHNYSPLRGVAESKMRWPS
jgi:hypothetical protein